MMPLRKAKHPWVVNSFFVLIIAVVVSLITAFFTAQYLNDKVQTQGQNGLQLFYTQALAQCRDTRANSLKLAKFSNILDHQFRAGQHASVLISRDKKISEAQRQAALDRVAGYQIYIDALPHPTVKKCTETVKSPTELAQQVRNTPGKSTTTTTPVKGKK